MIGSAALARFKGDVSRAFTAGSASCNSGYPHGILERALVRVGIKTELVAAVRRLCADPDVRATDFIAYQCVHGLGHGLMIHTGLDLRLSLSICEKLDTAWDQTSCDGGVFMENFSSSYGVKSRFLRDDNPISSLQRRRGAPQALLLSPGDVAPARDVGATTGSRPQRRAPAWRSTGARRASSRTDVTPRESHDSMPPDFGAPLQHHATAVARRMRLRRSSRHRQQRCGRGACREVLRAGRGLVEAALLPTVQARSSPTSRVRATAIAPRARRSPSSTWTRACCAPAAELENASRALDRLERDSPSCCDVRTDRVPRRPEIGGLECIDDRAVLGREVRATLELASADHLHHQVDREIAVEAGEQCVRRKVDLVLVEGGVGRVPARVRDGGDGRFVQLPEAAQARRGRPARRQSPPPAARAPAARRIPPRLRPRSAQSRSTRAAT